MIKFFIALAIAFVSLASAYGIYSLFFVLNIPKNYRYKQRNHMVFISSGIGIGAFLYFAVWLVAWIYEPAQSLFDRLNTYQIIPSLVVSSYMIFKVVYRIYFRIYSKKSSDILENDLPSHYYEKNKMFYIAPRYSTVSSTLKYSAMTISIIIALIILFVLCFSEQQPTKIIKFLETLFILPLFLFEMSSYFNGVIEDKNQKEEQKEPEAPESREDAWTDLDNEYRKLWQKQLLGRYNVANRYEKKIIQDILKQEVFTEKIAQKASGNKTNDFLYSRILSPIMRGEDIIIESCLLQSFSNIIVPIINIMFTASKRMMIVCDNQSTVKRCEKWLEELEIKSSISNSNIVIDVLNYENNESIKIDNNVDIYLGTVDLALNSKAIFDNIDVVFCVNVDRIISESALSINLLASVLSSDRYDQVQYILFGNRVNGLKQTASQVFMRNDFGYQVVNSSLENGLSANFWSTEKGWLQSAILPGFASQYLGQLIPLAMPAFKYDINHVDIVASGQSFGDQMVSLQTAQSLLKKYMNKDIVNLDEAITFAENENFLTLNDNSVVIVGDTNNNAALVLLNWLKYAKSNMFLNIVSTPYLLRDYLVSNMDFFIGNVEAVGNMLPVPKSNIKLSVYRLINQLCYGNVAEDTLLREIKSQETDIKVDTFENDQVRFVTEALEDLTRKAFNTNIFFTSYLTSERVSKDKSMESKRYYKLLDSIKDELPERLFKNITFIDSEQFAKVLKRIPVFELYQNYLEGQYVSFDGKYYLIDKIDYDNGIVELTYSPNNASVRYRQCRRIENVIHRGVNKELPVLKVRDSILKKSVLYADIEINTDGYYEFNNAISFAPGGFGYKKVDVKKKGLRRNYKSTNVLAINIQSGAISKMSEKDRFKLSFTFSVLLNEIFETLFSNINQYILVRNVVSNNSYLQEFSNNELVNLYRPIIDENIEGGITIYITEDTELEKGITDIIVNNFDNIIVKLLFDYLVWLTQENSAKSTEKWFESDVGDYINVEEFDKYAFLKFGEDTVNSALDLEAVFNCMYQLILDGTDTLTYSRGEFVQKRTENTMSLAPESNEATDETEKAKEVSEESGKKEKMQQPEEQPEEQTAPTLKENKAKTKAAKKTTKKSAEKSMEKVPEKSVVGEVIEELPPKETPSEETTDESQEEQTAEGIPTEQTTNELPEETADEEVVSESTEEEKKLAGEDAKEEIKEDEPAKGLQKILSFFKK